MTKKLDSHGYVIIYEPTHHRAKQNGMVYEHTLIAEEMLGRKLRKLEVVHHEDRNKSNNTYENLYVFATKEDHVRYHHNNIMIKVDDYYIATSIIVESSCVICENIFLYNPKQQTGKYCSRKCSNKSQRRVDRPTKEVLLSQIETLGYVGTGKIYGVSDNAIRKWLLK